MRDKIMYALLALAGGILAWNFHTIFFDLPKAAANVGAYQIIYVHVPAAFTAFTGFILALTLSCFYLASGDLKYDAFAASITETALVFATVNLVTGSIWGRFAWGIWWTWDARLTSMLTCWLMYAGYLMLRRAISEPTQRAKLSAVLSIFGCVNVAFVYKSIEWYRTQHPAPVLSFREGGGMAPGMQPPIYWDFLAFLCLGIVMVLIRMRQEEVSREIDSLRRMAHAH